jgi:hypothetical protein
LSLATARDGVNSQHTIIRECQEWLNQAHFDRDTARFTFTSYCDKFIHCYNELEQRNVFTNKYLKVDKFLSGITNSSFHSTNSTIIADNAADGKMNDLQLEIVYANTAFVALGFIPITSHMSPRRRIGMNDSEESHHAFGSNSDNPIRGRGRGRGRPQHGFAQGHGGPTRQRGGSPYHSPRGGRGQQRFGLNRSPRGGRGNFNDESFIPRELFQQLSLTQRSISLRGQDVYNSRGGNLHQIQIPNDRSIGSVHQVIPPPPHGPPPIRPDIGSSSSISASSQFGHGFRTNRAAGWSTFMMSRVNCRSVGSQSVDMYQTVFTTPGSPYHSARCEMDSRADTVCAGENFIPLFHHGTECDVSGYPDELGTMKNIPVLTVATAIYDVNIQKTHILIFAFALYFGPKIKKSLICLNQCREGGTIIYECPRQFNPASKHGLTSPDETLFVPFQMHGQTSFFLSR